MRENILGKGPEPITITTKEQAEAIIASILGGKSNNGTENTETDNGADK